MASGTITPYARFTGTIRSFVARRNLERVVAVVISIASAAALRFRSASPAAVARSWAAIQPLRSRLSRPSGGAASLTGLGATRQRSASPAGVTNSETALPTSPSPKRSRMAH